MNLQLLAELDFYTVEIFDAMGKLYQTINQVGR